MGEGAREGVDGGVDGGGGFFVVGELLDEAEDCGDVCGDVRWVGGVGVGLGYLRALRDGWRRLWRPLRVLSLA